MTGDRPRRVVLHAGFHKTGTTTVQTFLHQNSARLSRHILMAQNADLRDFIQATRSHSLWRDPISASQIADRITAHLAGLDWGDRSNLLISVEEISGLLPGLPQKRGRPDVDSYAMAPALIGIVAAAIRAALGRDTILDLIYGTRAPDSWLRSVYWQHVKVQRMTMDVSDFVTRYRPAADLDAVVDAVSRENPGLAVHRFQLEQTLGSAFGPIGPVLRLAGISDNLLATCRVPPPANIAPPVEVLLAMLDLNRSDIPADALKTRKKAMEDAVRAPRHS